MSKPRSFLSAEWRYLLMLNYEIEPSILAPLIPAGTELDTWQGKTLVSMVGFLFMHTRLLGLPIPFHENFEEVNLRFYVRRSLGGEERRGVVFIKEIVPRIWIARLARWLYAENYAAMPMGHAIDVQNKKFRLAKNSTWLAEYTWRHKSPWWNIRGKVHRLGALVTCPFDEPNAIQPGSEEEFITEHYWGYTRLDEKTSGEYRVEHPTWRVWTLAQPYLLSDIKSLYGEQYEPALRRRPRSAFLAEGSPVKVYFGNRFTNG